MFAAAAAAAAVVVVVTLTCQWHRMSCWTLEPCLQTAGQDSDPVPAVPVTSGWPQTHPADPEADPAADPPDRHTNHSL